MSIPYAAILFYVGVIALGTLPFVPAFREIRLHRDAIPLQVTRRSRVDVRHFANGFQEFVARQFTSLLDESRHTGRRTEGHSADLGSYVVLPPGDSIGTEEIGARILLGSGDIAVVGGGMIEVEVFSQGDLIFENAVVLRAALAERTLELAPGAKVLRWTHAEDELIVGASGVLYGRASASRSMVLGEGVLFERVHAPTIHVGVGSHGPIARPEQTESVEPRELGSDVDFSGSRALVRGDVFIPDGTFVDYDLVAHGDLVVGQGAVVRGSLKARRVLRVGSGAWVEGSLICEGEIHVERGAFVHGPLLAEGSLHLERDVQVGHADRPSTARGHEITVAAPARIHGTMWAGREGRVVAS